MNRLVSTSLTLALLATVAAAQQVEKPNPVAQKPATQKPATQKAAPPRVAPAAPAGEALAITNARIMTGTGTTIERGTIVLRGGRIAAG